MLCLGKYPRGVDRSLPKMGGGGVKRGGGRAQSARGPPLIITADFLNLTVLPCDPLSRILLCHIASSLGAYGAVPHFLVLVKP